MPEGPLPLETVLKEEAAALRPDGDRSVPFSALCISGGGIRSATFALGALQSMAEHGLLPQFDYLSTVSGGGYIGGWLSAWAKHKGGVDKVVPLLRSDAPEPKPGEPDPIQHLREYNNYLSPKLGGFSSDTWTLITTVVRNIVLNWLVLIPLLLCFLMAPRILLSLAYLSQHYALNHPLDPGFIANSGFVRYGLPGICQLLFFVGMLNTWRYLPGIGGVNHTGSDYMKWVLLPLTGAAVSFCAYDALHFWSDEFGTLSLSQCVIGALEPAALSWVVFLFICRRSLQDRVKLFVQLTLAVGLLALSLGSAQWLVTNRVASSASFTWEQYVTIVPPLIGMSFFAAMALFAGFSSGRLEDQDREWMSRASAGILLTSVAWIASCLIVLVAPGWVFLLKGWSGGALTTLGTVSALASRLTRRDGRPPAGKPAWVGTAVKLAPPVFILSLAVGLAILTNVILHYTAVRHVPWWDHENLLEESTWSVLLGMQIWFFAVAWVAARYININKFSLHGMYRDRLVRAYLGASNPLRYGKMGAPNERPNQFTGFAQSDNLKMHKLLRKPLHVVNLTLNLVSGQRLAWQQRKAASFTVSPLHCGNLDLGYRPSTEYGGKISLGSAITISGAAASPNMGYHSSAATGFIMTLLNARLGAWLGNPGEAGNKTWRLQGPRSAVGSLLAEAFGLTNDESAYVYLSDGGHFENLGLYEMVVRRCRSIVVLDAGCDADFTYEDLGNALRKIRIDLRIPIEFESIRPDKRCAVARIDYEEGEPGHIVYLKPRLLGDEPPDVGSYCKSNPTFPHQSTADQWFDESQTESYRMLGKFTMDSVCRGWNETEKLTNFADHVRTHYLGAKGAAAAV